MPLMMRVMWAVPLCVMFFFFSSRRRHTRCSRDWSSDVCSSDLVGLESQVPGIYKRNLPPLTSKYGFNDHEVEFFAIHIEADEVHGERGYQIVERHSDTAERRAQALEQVRQATEMRWQYMSGLHRAYGLKEEP